MEAALGEKNVRGDIKFIVSPSAKAVLKSTAKNQNSFIMEGNEVNGYPVLCTSAVAGKGIVYGNFADLVIGQWGGNYLMTDNGKLSEEHNTAAELITMYNNDLTITRDKLPDFTHLASSIKDSEEKSADDKTSDSSSTESKTEKTTTTKAEKSEKKTTTTKKS